MTSSKDKFKALEDIFRTSKPIIGMIHLDPLPGSPRYENESMEDIAESALEEAHKLHEGGFHGAIMENFGDYMFLKRVNPETVAAMTYVASEIRRNLPDLTLGICVLQSDAIAALAIAHIVGADFVRVPYYTETYIVDAGVMESIAADALRYRNYLNIDVKIFADVHIKHGYPLSQRPIWQSARDAEHRGMADAILVTGIETGKDTDPSDVKAVKEAVNSTPVFVASGVDKENFHSYQDYADGVIVGTRLKEGNKTEAPLDTRKISEFMDVVQKIWSI